MKGNAPVANLSAQPAKVGDETRQDLPPGLSRTGRFFMAALALQFGLQPVLQKACVEKDEVNPSSLITVIEATKVVLCALVILSSGRNMYRPMLKSWTPRRSLEAAALPAAGYSLQSWLSQLAYKNLDSMTFNLLSQTKTLFAALCLYLIMGTKQSHQQLVALSLLLSAALLLKSADNNSGAGSGESGGSGGGLAYVAKSGAAPDVDVVGLLAIEADVISSSRLWLGVLPVLGASFISGLCGVLTQRTLQRNGGSASQLSLELAAYGVLVMLVTSGSELTRGLDEVATRSESGWMVWQGFFHGWTCWTWLPVLSQAAGGLVVGQVTKHAGSVQKGFALIGGILVTAAAQSTLERSALTPTHWIAAMLVAGGTYLHSNYPYRPPEEPKKSL